MQTEIFRGYQKQCDLTAQTAVECRFGQEVSTVLLTHASASLTGAECTNGEVRYFGKAHFIVVYEDDEKRVCRAEKGVEFTATCKDERVTPAFTPRACVTVENVSLRREGASVFLTALLGADISLYGEESFEYLTGGDFVCKREPVPVLCAHLCGGATEADDEFETEFIGDILLHAQTASIVDVICETGSVKVEGEVNLTLLALKGEGNLVSFERLVPFRVEIPCEEATFTAKARARANVLDVSLRADSDEEKGRCKITAELTLGVEACVYEEVTVDGVVDAFSCTHDLALAYYQKTCKGAGEISRHIERVSGRCALSSPVDFTDTLQAISLGRAEANLLKTEGGAQVEGVVLSTLLVRGEGGAHRGIEMSLPFSVPVKTEGNTVGIIVCGLSARQKQEGEIEAEATLKLTLQEESTREVKVLSTVVEGEATPVCDSAISVYIPCAGDGLWETAKRLKKSPEEVSASNPDLEFPIQEGRRIVIYRKKNLTSN